MNIASVEEGSYCRFASITVIIVLTISGCRTNQQKVTANAEVKIVGAMHNVMQKGELFGRIALDTIANRNHLYGIGPLALLKGEILVLDGKAYTATIAPDGGIRIGETYHVGAPFFVYANVESWNEVPLPDSIQTLQHVEVFLNKTTNSRPRPFVVRIEAMAENIAFHVVDLPDGAEVHSPEDAHRHQKNFMLTNTSVELVGFFSTQHQGVFTHHDSFIHIHVMTADKNMMGHLDDVRLKKGSAVLHLSSKLL